VVLNIFDNLLTNYKQIILTGNKPVTEIKNIQNDLMEKFKDASTLKLLQQSTDLKKEILKKEVTSVFEMVDELIDDEASDEDLESLKEKLAQLLVAKKGGKKGKKK
jgi:chromosomal replication initiation ATPase DnaA